MALSNTAKDVLTNWFAKKPAIALMGEFSAGKSTLLNLLLDGDHMPTKVTATNLPAVWVTYSDTPFTEGLTHDGVLEAIDVEALGEDVREQYLLLRFGVKAPILERTDFVDTPGISDPKLAKGATLFLAPYLDSVLWLSPANQAWRQSEKAVWTDFPKTLRDTSLIVMTRADKLRRKSDLTKVMKRVTQETKGLFNERVSLNTPLAASSKATPDAKEWESSGGKLFYAALEKILNTAEAAQANRKPEDVPAVTDVAETAAQPQVAEAKADPETQIEVESDAVHEVVADAPAKQQETVKVLPVTTEGTKSDFVATTFFRNLTDQVSSELDFSKIKSLFEHSAAQLEEQKDINPLHKVVLKQCLSVGDSETVNVERLLEQAVLEIADFDRDCWCVIAPN